VRPGRPTSGSRLSGSWLRVHAVEDTAVQLTWAGLPAREVTIGVGDRTVEVAAAPPVPRRHRRLGDRPMTPWPTGPGAVVVDGLEPGTSYPVWLREPGRARHDSGRVTTLRPPPGALLTQFVTVSDLHVGERRFGAVGALLDNAPPGQEPYPVRCARAALEEAKAWGAGVVVAKGDLTDRASLPEIETAAGLLAGCGMRPLVQLGNHDASGSATPAAWVPRLFGPDSILARDEHVATADLPGVRVVLGDSPAPRSREGHLSPAQLDELVDAAASAGGPVVVCLHHPPMRWPVPVSYPPGIDRDESRQLLVRLRRVNPAVVVLAGHSHRNRTYTVDGVRVAEIGSTKDYPGGWAGYAVHEGGIRQVVRRTSRPDVIAWTESTSAAVGGVWGRWSPGSLADRCWSYTWPKS